MKKVMEKSVEKEVIRSEKSSSKEKDVKKEKERHCFCKSKIYSTFMICCDTCEKWYHGECVEITRSMSKKIEKYYCFTCMSKDNSLSIVYKGKKECTPRMDEKKEVVEKREKRTVSASISNSSSVEKDKCGNCIGCLWNTDCGKCANCSVKQQPCLKRICVQAGQQAPQPSSQSSSSGQSIRKRKISKSLRRDTEESDSPSSPPAKVGRRPVNKTSSDANSATNSEMADKRLKREKEASNATIAANLAKVYNSFFYRQQKRKKEEEKQCIGPGCINSARPNSSYCSDECGLALAERRLKLILPERIENFYNARPQSEIQDEEKLRALAEDKNKLEEELKSLDECVENVKNWISSLSSVQNNGCSETNAVDDGTFMVTCAVCTVECSIRNIGKHMHRCFVRTERQSTYGTAHKLPQNPRELLCDAYNKIDKSYCKRLRVMCSEHFKEEDEIKFCGAPLIWFDGKAVEFKKLFVDAEILNERMFCMEKRKHCNVHSNWAQNALGLLDNERMNILYQLDENNDKRRRLQQSFAARGDILSLLCNYTVTGPHYQKPTTAIVETVNGNES